MRPNRKARRLSAASAGCAGAGVCPFGAQGPSRSNEAHRHRAYGKRRSHGNRRIRKPRQRDLFHKHRKTNPNARPADAPTYQDRLSKQAALVRQHYRLSARETEVMELIARGNTVARIAEQLVVSENTIRTHSKRIYAKLDIHKKQELVDLLETFNPKDLED